MKRYLVTLSIIASSLCSYAQKKNVLLNICNIGDTIYKLPDSIYCEINSHLTRNLTDCATRQFRYFPTKNDTSTFKFVKFESILIIGDAQNIVTQIILINSYSSDDLMINASLAEKDFSILKKYLDKQLKTSAVDVRGYFTGGTTIKGFKWYADPLTYVIRLIPPQNKKKQKSYSLQVKIF